MPSGEVDREVFEHLTHNTLSVRFEINIVKVCCYLNTCNSFANVSLRRCLGYHYTDSSSVGRVVMAGSTRCLPGAC
jgi:hypothetical protein